MILHNDKETFNDLIETTVGVLGIPAVFIEKDYWVTYILNKLSKSNYKETAIFKGGTSLSKAYKIIDRFSEDIDLAIITDDIDGNAVKTLIKNIEKALLDENFEETTTPQTSKGSKFRKTVHQYPKIIEGDFGHANENLIIELNSFAKPHPYISKTISTYIYDFLKNQSDEAKKLIGDFQLEPFEINVLDYKRTLCEKISAVARASFESDDMNSMIQSVREDDQKQFSSDWANVKLHSTKIFENINILDELDSYYNSNFKTLVYSENLPNMQDIKAKFEELAKILKERDL